MRPTPQENRSRQSAVVDRGGLPPAVRACNVLRIQILGEGNGMKLSRFVSLYFFLLFCFCVLSVRVCRAQAASPQTVVVRAGRLLDVKTGKTLTNQVIVIQGDRIVSVGSDERGAGTRTGVSALHVPEGATVVDLSNATVLPGLIDAHTHLTYAPNFGY